MRRLFSLFLFLFAVTAIFAQPSECEALQSAAKTTGLEEFLSGKNKVGRVCVVSESDEHIAISVEYQGFDDQEYKIVAKVLGTGKKPLKEFETINQPMTKGGGTADLQFEFKRKETAYTSQYVESKYLSFSIAKKDDKLAELDLGGESVFGSAYLYKLERKWRVGGGSSGNSNVTVTVKLTPYKSASTIKQ